MIEADAQGEFPGLRISGQYGRAGTEGPDLRLTGQAELLGIREDRRAELGIGGQRIEPEVDRELVAKTIAGAVGVPGIGFRGELHQVGQPVAVGILAGIGEAVGVELVGEFPLVGQAVAIGIGGLDRDLAGDGFATVPLVVDGRHHKLIGESLRQALERGIHGEG